jgi:16S rRNA G966 N2-methylase RsmD
LRLQATVLCSDVLRVLSTERGTYDLVILDPPYDFRDHERVAPYLKRVLAGDGLVVYETGAKTQPEIEGLETRTSRKYGSARITLFEH